MIRIRNIEPKDIDSFMNFLSRSKYNTDNILINIEDFMLCEIDDEIVGCCCGVKIDTVIYLNHIIVAENYRHQKIGTAIVKAVLNKAEIKGIKYAYMLCEYDKFAEALLFKPLRKEASYDEVLSRYSEIYKHLSNKDIYFAELENYFKPCCC